MKEEPVNATDNPSFPSVEPEQPYVNYSRWMTEMAGSIAPLKLYHLAIPGAHNSGVDMAGTWGFEELFAACQNKSFSSQLASGARYLDLRLEDKSYWKMEGHFAPTRKFVECFEFTHGDDSFWYDPVSAGRTLQYLVNEAKIFAETNPGEIIFLDFHRIQNLWSEGLQRIFPHFTPIKHLLIPKSASDLSIEKIRSIHPGRNIVLCFEYGFPANWNPEWVNKEDLWPKVKHVWSADYSEQAISDLVTNAMKSPPTRYWALSAAARDGTGPKHLPADHPIRTEAFIPGRQNANILMVDFIERSETVTSVTDKCIALNIQRSQDAKPPTTPTNLTAKQVLGDNLQNTVEFSWNRADDGVGLRQDQVFGNEELLFTTSDIPHREKNLSLKNYTLKVRAVNFLERTSEFSAPFTLVQDTTPPTVPTDFKVSKLGLTILELEWQPASDAAGIAGYEISIDNQPPTFTTEIYITFKNLTAAKQYVAKVRAKDINELWSEYTQLVIPPRPARILANPILKVASVGQDDEFFTGYILWDLIDAPHRSFSYGFKVNDSEYAGIHEEGIKPNRFLAGLTNRAYSIEAWIQYHTGEVSNISTFDFTYNTTAPLPISGLIIESRTLISTTIKWDGSPSQDAVNYAISLNEQAPILVPATQTNHEFLDLPADETFHIEVWTVNKFGMPSPVQPLTINPIPLE